MSDNFPCDSAFVLSVKVEENQSDVLNRLISLRDGEPKPVLVDYDVVLTVFAEPTQSHPSQWVKVVRWSLAAVVVALACFALTQPGCAWRAWHHVSEHAWLGVFVALFRLWVLTKNHNPKVGESLTEMKKNVKHSTKEGVIAAIADAIGDVVK